MQNNLFFKQPPGAALTECSGALQAVAALTADIEGIHEAYSNTLTELGQGDETRRLDICCHSVLLCVNENVYFLTLINQMVQPPQIFCGNSCMCFLRGFLPEKGSIKDC
jgi:hypothetical protein